VNNGRVRDPGAEIDELLLHLSGLVRVRSLLARRHASEAELEAHSAEIGRLRWRLAQAMKRLGRER
jgi:hypothetical protein